MASGVGPESENVTGTVGRDVAADARSGRLSAAYLHRRLPRSHGSSSSVDEDRAVIVPDYVDIIPERRAGAVVNPHELLVSGRLSA